MLRRRRNGFYDRMAASQYETIYGDMSDDLKDTATPDSMIAFLKQINERLGVCNTATLVGNDYSKVRGRFAGLVYKRRCAHGDVSETLAWRITDGRAFLRAYKPVWSCPENRVTRGNHPGL